MERFRPIGAASRGSARAELGLPRDAFLFACAARLEPVKRHQDLIEGFRLVAARHTDAELLLIGTGALEADLRMQVKLAGLTGRVHFLGKRGDIERLLPLLDAFVLCSLTEGMSNALLEAMACGLPVIATAVGGNSEAVLEGSTGLLVPPRATDKIGAAMLSLIEDRVRSRAWGANARLRVGNEFSVSAMVEKFELLYQDCVTKGART
jgi:glycosyltransferase involved in cell wall biosynthesis